MNTIYYLKHKNNTIWNKDKLDEILDKKSIISKDKVMIKKTNLNKLIQKDFILTEDNIFLMNKDQIKSSINLNFLGIECNKIKLVITLFTNEKYFNLFFENINIFKKWKLHLSNKCLLNNFHKKYEIINKIEDGNKTGVYLAKKISTSKKYAVKIIPKDEMNESKLNNLVNEIEIIRSLNHPNIIKFKQIFESKNSFFIIMKYCDFSLKNYLKLESKYKDKIRIIKQLLSSLEYIHSMKLVHRDLKPDNIFLYLDDNNKINLKLGDFGLCNYLNKEFIFKRCGTPGYISPEILNYNKSLEYSITTKVDIYSFGHILYNILANEFLFEFEDVTDLLKKNKINDYSIKNIKCSKFKFIIKNCWKTDPEERISIREIRNYFNEI